jgi:cell division protease FtsH
MNWREMMNSPRFRNTVVYVLIGIAVITILYSILRLQPANSDEIPLNTVAADIRGGRIKDIEIEDTKITLTYGDNSHKISYLQANANFDEVMKNYGVTPEDLATVKLSVKPPSDWTNIFGLLSVLLPVGVIIFFFYFMLRQAQGTNNQALSFGKSRARMFTGEQPTVTFDDVAGVEEAKEELREVVEFLKEPEKFISLGARIPKGVLLVGSPGTGKTLLAKAVSGEAGVPFFSISGSEFVEMFVGVGASRVRDLFDQAKRHSPCIIFVDEIDAVGRHRGAGLGGSHDEREQTLNQILVEMDGFDTDTNVIVVAATNRPDILDPALLRPGRFDRRVVLDRPDVRGREGILRVHVRGKPLGPDIDLSTLARSTTGFVGADLENMVNEAAILAARRNKKQITMSEMREAIERVIAGPERKSRLITPREREVTAWHEAGHAVVMHLLPNCDPVQKVTIIPRGMAMGYTMGMPEEDLHNFSRTKFLDEICALLGGRTAEELHFGEITTGASNDLERVSNMSRSMVTRYGMSDRLGPMVFGKKEELVFLGKDLGEQRDYSESVAQMIDEEVSRIVSESHARTLELLRANVDKLEAVARRVLEIETLDAVEFEQIMGNRPARPAASPATPRAARPAAPGAGESPLPAGGSPVPVPG